jgi:ATP-dependent Clp endopeptidase proteolytic subunit ClpP
VKKWFTISNKAADKGPVEVLLYGEIGGGWSGDGVEAKAFKEEFDAIPKGSAISLRIHSPGGSVYDGLAIYNTIHSRSSDVTAHVDGLAASAASFIAMAASRVVMPKTSRMMIHDAQGYAFGDSKELKEMAEILDRESDRIADIYATKTGKTRSTIRDLMKATTWMDGNEAKDLGFADEVTDKEAVKNDFDLSVFRHVPATPHSLINGPMNVSRNTQSIVMTRTQIIALLNKYGVTHDEKTTDEQLVALLETTLGDLKAKAEKPPETPVTDPTDKTADRLAALEAKAERERVARITAEVTSLCAERRIESSDWVANCLGNETVIAALRKLPVVETSKPLALGAPQNKALTLTEQCKLANGIK